MKIALQNIRSLQNVGAIFRTCNFFGIKDIVLVGYTGKGKDHYDRQILHPKIAKTSLGSEKYLNIQFIDSEQDLLNYAKKNKSHIICIEQDSNSISLDSYTPSKNDILVFGNEVTGITEPLLKESDQIVEIARVGEHKSLNVATTVGIVLYKLSTN